MKDTLFKLFLKRKPKYSLDFEKLINDLAVKYGVVQSKKELRGKNFANIYEIYIYAFFLGLYNDKLIPVPETSELKEFIEISQFGRTNKLGRKDFSDLQKYIFMACIAKTDINLIELDKGDVSVNKIIRSLITTMESYANGGFILLDQAIEENPEKFYEPTFFLNLIKDAVPKKIQAEEVI